MSNGTYNTVLRVLEHSLKCMIQVDLLVKDFGLTSRGDTSSTTN